MNSNFFIPYTELDDEKKQLMKDSDIDFLNVEVDGEDGVIIEGEIMYNALESMGSDVKSKSETSIEGILKVSLIEAETPSEEYKPKPKTFDVEVDSWDGRQKSEFVEVARDLLLPHIKKDVVFRVPHKGRRDPINDDKFYILIWATPKVRGDLSRPPSSIWGIEVDCRDEGFNPSGKGVPFVDNSSGWTVGELVDNNLYIHHDLCHKGTEREIEIFKKLCKKVVNFITMSPEERWEIYRDLYINECSIHRKKKIRETEEEIEEGRETVEKLQKKLVNKIRKTKEAEEKAKLLRDNEEEEILRCGKEFDSLTNIEEVEDVKVRSGVIEIYTSHIYITLDDSSTTFDIGKFRMEIHTKGEIRFFNLTRNPREEGWSSNHPHVNEHGAPCLGNISEVMPNLIAEYQYSAVAQLGLQFLKSVNVKDEAGSTIFKYWPEKKPEEKES